MSACLGFVSAGCVDYCCPVSVVWAGLVEWWKGPNWVDPYDTGESVIIVVLDGDKVTLAKPWGKKSYEPDPKPVRKPKKGKRGR